MQNHEHLTAFFAAWPTTAAVLCEFDGGGDSGGITDIIPMRALDPCSIDDHFLQPKDKEAKPALALLREQVDDMAIDALDKQGVDWYNNDGGWGAVAFFRDGRVIVSTNQRFTDSTHYGCEFQLADFIEEEEPGAEVPPTPPCLPDACNPVL